MMFPNAFFTLDDPEAVTVGGYEIPSAWWSRGREYHFALQHTVSNMVCADMGAGWHYRPLYGALSADDSFVYAVDIHPGILQLPQIGNGVFVVADFTKPIDQISEKSLDRIFCISVLEETSYQDALIEFRRLLKPDGRIIITCDMPYDPNKPEHEKYKGIKLEDLEDAVRGAGLRYDGAISRVKDTDKLLRNDALNLCVFHAVLKKG